MVLLAPAAVVVLVLLMAANAPFSTIKRGGAGREWASLTQLTLLFWAALMMPLYIGLEAALVAGIDHAENQWKSLFTRPVPRWTWYIAKLILVLVMLGASTLILLTGILLSGALLPRPQPELAFGLPVPWASILQKVRRSRRWPSYQSRSNTGSVYDVVRSRLPLKWASPW